MGVSAGALGTGAVISVIGAVVLLFGLGLFASGPLFTAEHSSESGFLGTSQRSSSSASLNLMPVLGLVLVVIGAVVLLAGLRGVMHSFERGKEREEGTRHHLTVERK